MNVYNTEKLSNNNKQRLFELYTITYGKVNKNKLLNIKNFKNKINYYGKCIIYKNKNNIIQSATLYWNGPLGKKFGLSFGIPEYQIKVMLPYIINRLKSNNHWYAEASHGVEHFFQKKDTKAILNENIIRHVVPNARNINKTGQYTRNISNLGPLKKRLYGNPKVPLKSRL